MNAFLKVLALFTLTLCGAFSANSIHAQPVQLSEAEYQQQTDGLPRIVETFDQMPLGTPATPLQLANGRYYGEPQIMELAWCLYSRCLATNFDVEVQFADFPAETSFWSGRIIHASDGNLLDAIVVGNSGTQVFRLPADGFVAGGVFVGFHDPQGLQSVRFERVAGSVNYSFDDVETAMPLGTPEAMSVPIQSPWALAMLSLILLSAGLLAMRRR